MSTSFRCASVAVEIIERLGDWPLNDVFNGYQATLDFVPHHRLEHRINGWIGQVERLRHGCLRGFFRVCAWRSQESQLHEPSLYGGEMHDRVHYDLRWSPSPQET